MSVWPPLTKLLDTSARSYRWVTLDSNKQNRSKQSEFGIKGAEEHWEIHVHVWAWFPKDFQLSIVELSVFGLSVTRLYSNDASFTGQLLSESKAILIQWFSFFQKWSDEIDRFDWISDIASILSGSRSMSCRFHFKEVFSLVVRRPVRMSHFSSWKAGMC